ncbi:hypothetical protein MKW98_029191 [Papaver atlanticum]|uniref:Bet v I/Major latex protein domain-containing protein n=1 Tax=Papaver atlanticum TaxID=357466 RepID=A0AAD4T2H9_9MAGN|nr:hypothetical protein MKW98_029191 [Papaver atlanticum]
MAEIRKVEVECIAKFSAEKFYAMATRDAPKLPKYAPQTVRDVQVLPGDGEVRVGSVYAWDYLLDGKPSVVGTKTKITAMDNKNMSLTFTVIDGYLTDDYKSYATVLITTPIHRNENHNCCSCKKSYNHTLLIIYEWSAQYQKANEDVRDPIYMKKLVEDFIKELDTNLLKEAE